MKSYPTLQELLHNDPQSRQLFDTFPPDTQVAVQEQRQNIHTYEDLHQIAASFQRRNSGR
ncbi:MAG: hypothetical protein E7323_02950 [Clostridiales bacterium]|nr:hypothetical protein [Clostridiales bacterium]